MKHRHNLCCYLTLDRQLLFLDIMYMNSLHRLHLSFSKFRGDTQMPLSQKDPSRWSLNTGALPVCIFKEAIREMTSLAGPGGRR